MTSPSLGSCEPAWSITLVVANSSPGSIQVSTPQSFARARSCWRSWSWRGRSWCRWSLPGSRCCCTWHTAAVVEPHVPVHPPLLVLFFFFHFVLPVGFHFVLGRECLMLSLWNIMQISFLRRENISRQRHGEQTPRPRNMNIKIIAPFAKHTDSSKSFT